LQDVEIKNIDESNFEDIPNQPPFDCQSCICFEYPDLSEKTTEKIARKKKIEWFKKTRKMPRSGGKILYLRGKPVGFCQYAPPHLLPLSKTFCEGCPPPSDDAIYVSCIRILKGYRRRGLATLLLKEVIEDLTKRDVKAIETFAGRDINFDNFPSGPLELYLKLGFKIVWNHKNHPLMRLELK
jgi:ribosomal protein S18 acetylase RimI-like enzyme